MTTKNQYRKRAGRFLTASFVFLVLAGAVALLTADTASGPLLWVILPLTLGGILTLIISWVLDWRAL